MPEILEHFGTPCELPEPDIVGTCEACGGDIYDYELGQCDKCGTDVHTDCLVKCVKCAEEGCKKCMLEDKEMLEYFCDEDCQNNFRDFFSQEEYTKEYERDAV